MKPIPLSLAALALLAAPAAADAAKNRARAGIANTAKVEAVTAPPPPVVQDYEPKPAMWKLADADTTIYLFGTSHILPSGFRWRTPAFDRVVAEASELVVETSDADSDAQLEELAPELFSMGGDRATTSSRLAPANADKWRQLASGTGMPFAAFDRMPVLLAMLGAGLSLSRAQGSDHEYGVETVLEAEFAKAGKPIGSIEDSVAVLRALLAIDDAPLIAQLDKDLSEWDGKDLETLFAWSEDGVAEGEADPFADEHRWAQGEMVEVFTEEDRREPAMIAIHDVLLTDRNRAWAGWLKQRLEKPGTVLVAVGAGHFAGEVSVQTMLAEHGLAAERVQ